MDKSNEIEYLINLFETELQMVAETFAIDGNEKYGNRVKLEPDFHKVNMAKALRHLSQQLEGKIDEDSGLPPLAHCIARMIKLLYGYNNIRD